MSVNKTQQIICAITKGNKSLVADLIAQGVDINHANHFNVTPLEIALKTVNTEIVNFLILHGAILKPTASNFYHSQVKWHIYYYKNSRQSRQNEQ
ncbi:MAG: ankyrin repeat domain-containing protein [Thalassotalea sp.]